jgi:hypothetical protein
MRVTVMKMCSGWECMGYLTQLDVLVVCEKKKSKTPLMGRWRDVIPLELSSTERSRRFWVKKNRSKFPAIQRGSSNFLAKKRMTWRHVQHKNNDFKNQVSHLAHLQKRGNAVKKA